MPALQSQIKPNDSAFFFEFPANGVSTCQIMSRNNAAKAVMQCREKNQSLSKSNSSSTLSQCGSDPNASSNRQQGTDLRTFSASFQDVSLDSNSSDASCAEGCLVSVELEEQTALTKEPKESKETKEPKEPSVMGKLKLYLQSQNECCEGSCCANQIVQAVNLTTALNLSKTSARVAGVMIGLAVAFTSDCWLEHPPFIGDVLGVLGSLGATVTLNSIEWDVIVSSNAHVHQQVIIVLLICYGIIFFQGGVVIWHLVQSPHASHWEDECHEACCAAVEGYYCLLVLSGCSLLRFAVPLEGLQNASYNSVILSAASASNGSLGKGGSIGVTVGAALLLVASALLQLFATFGKYGSSTALFVPMPVILVMPFVLITRVKSAQSGERFGVWTGWECFLPAWLYVFATLWPFALYHRDYLSTAQLILCSFSILCLLITARCLVCIVESKADSQSGGRIPWQFPYM